MTEYVTLEQAAVAFAIQSVFSTIDCLDALHYAIQKGWISPSDIAPVRHGRWIHTDLAAHWYGKDECSECTYHEHDRRDLSHFNFCPNCGAKMDLE